MNNSFPRLIDGMCATLRNEVLTRLDDDFARGQVFGVINLLNTFKTRADWSAGFLLQQITAQQQALAAAHALLTQTGAGNPDMAHLPAEVLNVAQSLPVSTPITELLTLRDEGNRAMGALLQWLDAKSTALPAKQMDEVDNILRAAMRAEVDIEIKNSSRPMFAQMSSGQEG